MPRIMRVQKKPTKIAKAVKTVKTVKPAQFVNGGVQIPFKPKKIIDAAKVPKAVAGVLANIVGNAAAKNAIKPLVPAAKETKPSKPAVAVEPFRFNDGKTFAETVASNRKAAGKSTEASKSKAYIVTDTGAMYFASRAGAESYLSNNKASANTAMLSLRAAENTRARFIAEQLAGVESIEVEIQVRLGTVRIPILQIDNCIPTGRLQAMSLLAGGGRDENEWGDSMSAFYSEYQMTRTLNEIVDHVIDIRHERRTDTRHEPAVVSFVCRDSRQSARYGADTIEFLFLHSNIDFVTNTALDITIPEHMHLYPNRTTHPTVALLFDSRRRENKLFIETSQAPAWLHVAEPSLIFDSEGRYAPDTKQHNVMRRAMPFAMHHMSLSGVDLDDILERVLAHAAHWFKRGSKIL